MCWTTSRAIQAVFLENSPMIVSRGPGRSRVSPGGTGFRPGMGNLLGERGGRTSSAETMVLPGDEGYRVASAPAQEAEHSLESRDCSPSPRKDTDLDEGTQHPYPGDRKLGGPAMCQVCLQLVELRASRQFAVVQIEKYIYPTVDRWSGESPSQATHELHDGRSGPVGKV